MSEELGYDAFTLRIAKLQPYPVGANVVPPGMERGGQVWICFKEICDTERYRAWRTKYKPGWEHEGRQ